MASARSLAAAALLIVAVAAVDVSTSVQRAVDGFCNAASREQCDQCEQLLTWCRTEDRSRCGTASQATEVSAGCTLKTSKLASVVRADFKCSVESVFLIDSITCSRNSDDTLLTYIGGEFAHPFRETFQDELGMLAILMAEGLCGWACLGCLHKCRRNRGSLATLAWCLACALSIWCVYFCCWVSCVLGPPLEIEKCNNRRRPEPAIAGITLAAALALGAGIPFLGKLRPLMASQRDVECPAPIQADVAEARGTPFWESSIQVRQPMESSDAGVLAPERV